MSDEIERLQQLAAVFEQRAEARFGLDAMNAQQSAVKDIARDMGLSWSDWLGVLKLTTGESVINELRGFVADPTMTADQLVDRVFEIIDKLASTNSDSERAELRAAVKRRLRRSPALADFVNLPANPLVKGAFDALLPGNLTTETNSMGFFAAYSLSAQRRSKSQFSGAVEGVIGYTDNPGDAIWRYIQGRGAMMAKLQLALWARVYHETDATPGEYVEVSIVQLCDDLGYKRKKGGHRREVKIEVSRALRSLLELRIDARMQLDGRTCRISGPLWVEGLQVELEELFEWVPHVVRFAPGDWFHTPAWRAVNGQVATVSAGALKLSTDRNDQAAVFLACYFATLARMNRNRPTSRLSARTLAEKSGLAQTYTRPGRLREAVERALERLEEVGVIKQYTLDTVDTCADPDDLDNPETLATMADDGAKTKRQWLSQVYIIEWPDEVVRTGPAIAAKREQHVKRMRRLSAQAGQRRGSLVDD